MTSFTSSFVCLKSPNRSQTGDDRPVPDPPPHRPTCVAHLPQLRHHLCHKVDINPRDYRYYHHHTIILITITIIMTIIISDTSTVLSDDYMYH